MNKKLLSVLLTIVMTVVMLGGCGKSANDNSSYFKELKEMSEIEKGKSVATIDFVVDPGDMEENEIVKKLKNSDGKIAVSLKLDMVEAGSEEIGGKILAKVGNDSDYSEVTTIAFKDQKLYLTTKPVIEFAKKIAGDQAATIETYLQQMGIGDAVSLDIKKVSEAMGVETSSDNVLQASKDFVNNTMNIFEKYFKDIQEQDGDDYVLKVNEENAEKAVDGLISLLKSDDAKTIIQEFKKLMEAMYSEEMMSNITGQISFDDAEEKLPDAAKKIEEKKQSIIDAIKEAKLNLVSKSRIIDGEGIFTLETGDVTVKDVNFNVKMNCEMENTKVDVESFIPENPSDVTTTLLTVFNSMQSLGGDTGSVEDAEDVAQ